MIVDGTLIPTGNRADSRHNYPSKRLRQGLNLQVAAIVPYKPSKYHDLTGYEPTVNETIPTRRSAVEWAISHLKNWKILAGGYRGRLTELPNIIRITSRLELYRLGWWLLNNSRFRNSLR